MLLTTWQIIKLIIWGIIIINEIAALYTVFREKRDIAATWAWLLVLTLIPVLGFILYAFLGRKLPQDKMERIQSQTELKLSAALEECPFRKSSFWICRGLKNRPCVCIGGRSCCFKASTTHF